MADEETYVSIAAIVLFLLIIIFLIGGSFMEHRKWIIGHETTLAILSGFAISLYVKITDTEHHLNAFFSFDGEIFFYLFLPPIVFSSGFNMRRKRFFENFGYVLLFGLLGTLICFVLFSLFT